MPEPVVVSKFRTPEYDVGDVFINRWSPRAFTGDEITQDEIRSLFEAAKWAPSSLNSQPWRFLYAKKNTEHWDRFFDLLAESNKIWAKNAAVLMVVISKKTFEHNGKPSRTHSFDAGAAWENLALQASQLGLATHSMVDFDLEKAKTALKIPDDYQIEVMVAVGRPANREVLPPELQKREYPSNRKVVAAIAFEGRFRR